MVGWTYIALWMEETKNAYIGLVKDLLDICYLTRSNKLMVVWKQ
jgi:hypothetical protein